MVCIRNEAYPASLELRKIYEQLSDPRAERHGLVRIADEEDEALYPASYFVQLNLSKGVQAAIESAAELELQHR